MKATILQLSFAIGLCFVGAPNVLAQGTALPWGQSSDQVGWETFALVTAPAGIAGSNDVEFETWATDEDIYLTTPPRWPVSPSPKKLHPSVLNLATKRLPLVIGPDSCAPPGNANAGNFPSSACLGEEVRRNWASFRYIVGNNLYSKAGLAAAAQSGLVVSLPADSIEVKAEWIKLSDLKLWQNNAYSDAQLKTLYHINTVEGSDGVRVEYALIAFHFSTKQIKNWVWSDFEHELNPGRCDDTGCHDSFGAMVKDVPAKNSQSPSGDNVNGNQPYGECAKSTAVEQMLQNADIGSVWRHYCLKGTQVTFINADGTPTLLGNSVIERIVADVPIRKSSCMTCHAFAAFKKDGSPNDIPSAPIGQFDPAAIAGMTQNDFIWGIFIAK
jgi:hypothetical protein